MCSNPQITVDFDCWLASKAELVPAELVVVVVALAVPAVDMVVDCTYLVDCSADMAVPQVDPILIHGLYRLTSLLIWWLIVDWLLGFLFWFWCPS